MDYIERKKNAYDAGHRMGKELGFAKITKLPDLEKLAAGRDLEAFTVGFFEGYPIGERNRLQAEIEQSDDFARWKRDLAQREKENDDLER